MAATQLNYHIDQNASYSTITLLPGLNEAQWSDIEKAGTDITGRLAAMRTPAVMVDLTPLNYMGSSMVAMIVRCWKNVQSNKGRIVVICNNDVVREVISLAGLTKVWPIVESREAALRELGVSASRSQGGEGGSDRLLAIAGIVAVVVGVVGAGLLLSQTGDRTLALGLLFGGSGLGFVLGLVTLMRSTDSSRYLGLAAVVGAVAVSVLGLINMNSVPPVAAEPPPAETAPEAAPAGAEAAGQTPPAAADPASRPIAGEEDK
ncbi:MAG: STAS domain-containing protein [Planctomycetaceae bacterium]|nr:STAS domain-containing protein [Planctomycetaceae bacterium]